MVLMKRSPEGKTIVTNQSVPPAIECENVAKYYVSERALDHLDLTVKTGERLLIVGPNGSGKSTLINLIGGLIRPTRGIIRINGINIHKTGPDHRKTIGIHTHAPFLYEDFTGRENLTFFGKMFDVDNVHSKITQTAELFNISHILDRRVSLLSHGNRKRLGLARTIIHDPSVILLDEPDSGLDSDNLGSLRETLTRKLANKTVILTSHNVNWALPLATNVLKLDSRKQALKISPEEYGSLSTIT